MYFKIDLQLFSAEKTEKPTPKKKREAREKGNVLQSKEVNSAFVLLAAFIIINTFAAFMGMVLKKSTLHIYEQYLSINYMFSIKNLQSIMIGIMINFFIIVAPIMVTGLIVGVSCSYLQVGALFTTKPLNIDINRLNPIEGFKRMFSMKSVVEILKASARILILGYMSYNYIKNQINFIFNSIGMDVIKILELLLKMSVNIGIRLGIALVVLAVLDYLYQRYNYNKNLMMTRQEIKEEYKQTEGDPKIKSRIREKQRAISMRRMMQDVPKADVIITNPTHFAVAVEYNPEHFDAPKVIAKGRDLVAKNIKRIALENNIIIVENKPLARALYDNVEIGQFVPPELYQAVAEVLAYVYRINNKI